MATLVNGNGNVAVYAQQDADLLTGALGASTRIMNVGSKMAYTIEDANTIAVADGVILTKEGRRIQVDVGNVDEFTIPTGSAGVTRYYIIGYHLYTDGSANQKCETFVQLMENGSETITENTFRNGASEVYVSLYRVKQIGLNLDTITALLSVGIALTDMTDVIGDTDISGIGDGTLTGGLNAVNQNLTEKVSKSSGTNVVDTEGTTHATTVTVDDLSYDATSGQLLMKVNGADTPLPFSGGEKQIYYFGTLDSDYEIVRIGNSLSYGTTGVSFGSQSFRISASGTTNVGSCGCTLYLKNAYNLSSYSSIEMIVPSQSGDRHSLVITDTYKGNTIKSISFTTGLNVIDVSDLSGNYYISIDQYSYLPSSGTVTCYADVYSIVLK